MRRNVIKKTILESGRAVVRDGNINGPPSVRVRACSSNRIARGGNGTRWLTLDFILAAGIVQVFEDQSISDHVAFRTSEVREPHKIRNSKASLTISPLSELLSSRKNVGSSR